MFGNGDPNQPANDVVAHEFGHLMDIVYAGDRCLQSCTRRQPRKIAEALADMFAYEYDRFDSTFAEETQSAVNSGHPYRNWANPGAETEAGLPYPAHIRDYEGNPPSVHFNSTILSHAYYRFVQSVGHGRAGRVLHNVPSLLPPQPTFTDVAMAFRRRACSIYGGATAVAADAAFDAVGITTNLSCHV